MDAESEISRAVTLRNGVCRWRAQAAVDATYLGFVFEYSLLADERAGGLATVWINPATRSVPRWTTWPADLVDDEPPTVAAGSVDVPWTLAVAAARSRLDAPLAAFLQSLTRGRDRDFRRLREYYGDIDQEIRRKLARARSNDEARRRDLERLDATVRSYRARFLDVASRYRVGIRLSPIAVFACRIPTHQLTVRLMRRTAVTDVVFSWNVVDGRIESRACDGCDTPVDVASLCDERVHYLCERCLSSCRQCGKPFCRACHADCPRRHQAQA